MYLYYVQTWAKYIKHLPVKIKRQWDKISDIRYRKYVNINYNIIIILTCIIYYLLLWDPER